ncbi:MAG: hypothetical protein ACOVOV_04465 [Dolichospermum sp.]|jgi:hypothetical protein
MSRINPRSLQNLIAGKNKRTNAVRVNARLNPETVELAKQIGDGEISKGLDKMASIYADVSLEDKLSEDDLIGWLNKWYANSPGEKIADPDYWIEKAALALSGLNFKRMILLGAKANIPESDRSLAIIRWWKLVS